MLPSSALPQLGKLIAADLAEGHFSGGLRDVGEMLAANLSENAQSDAFVQPSLCARSGAQTLIR